MELFISAEKFYAADGQLVVAQNLTLGEVHAFSLIFCTVPESNTPLRVMPNDRKASGSSRVQKISQSLELVRPYETSSTECQITPFPILILLKSGHLRRSSDGVGDRGEPRILFSQLTIPGGAAHSPQSPPRNFPRSRTWIGKANPTEARIPNGVTRCWNHAGAAIGSTRTLGTGVFNARHAKSR